MNRIRGTSLHAGRNIIGGIDLALSCGGRFLFGRMQPRMAQIAFLHHAAHPHCDVRDSGSSPFPRPRGIPPVEVARMIRTRGHAVAAAQAALRHLHDDSGGLIHFHRLLRANFHAGRVVLAVHAQDGDECFAARRSLPRHSKPCGRSIGVSPVRAVACGSAGTLFSAAQAIMHEPQPVQRSRSITMP